MSAEHLDIRAEEFNDIVMDIKKRNLSGNNMLKLITGTGFSLTYRVPGMQDLAKHLNRKIKRTKDTDLIGMWDRHYAGMRSRLKYVMSRAGCIFCYGF